MPGLTKHQAVEQLNRLFPGAYWTAEDCGLYKVSYANQLGTQICVRMSLPIHTDKRCTVARLRLNLTDETNLIMERICDEHRKNTVGGEQTIEPTRQRLLDDAT